MHTDDEMLMLSGIQHYRFCPRQWALFDIEQQWEDNVLTIEGTILHRRVDDPFYRQKCGDNITLRSVRLASYELGLYGIADVVELLPTEEGGITHPKYPGRWRPVPIEYKHGRPKRNEVDEVQVAAQAMCLEEMYSIRIDNAAFFYGEIKRRVEITITEEHRNIVRTCSAQMHEMFKSGQLPEPHYSRGCEKCSLINLCMPKISDCIVPSRYLENNLFR